MGLWQIVDRRTGKRVTQGAYLSEKAAGRQIDAWQDRHQRGGRPDVTREDLLAMEPRPWEWEGDRG